MSKSATRHQNFRFEFETVKNARADSPARTDTPPARVGFSKSWRSRNGKRVLRGQAGGKGFENSVEKGP